MRKPTNTSADTSADPLGFLIDAMSRGPSEAILAQEAAGQRELLFSDVLPVDMGLRSDYEALGFEFGDPDPKDPIFCPAKLPEGWRREGSEHSMWSFIVDAQGFRRVSIFYKAAFYDRSAHMGITRLPKTAAQEAAWESVEPEDEAWMSGQDRCEGDNYVYQWRGRFGDEAPHDRRRYDDNGRRLEVTVAPDGSVVSRREFTVEPEDDR